MAQDEKTIIRSLLDPKIKIDVLQVEDVFTGTSEKLDKGKEKVEGGQQHQNNLGTDYPFVQINGYVFSNSEIQYFKIDATDFLPSLTFTFRLSKSDAFRTQSYPKDGDVINVFIRAKNNAFKPIRNDYIIKNVDSGGGGRENAGGLTTLTCELFIPHIKEQIIKSYKGTSFDVLNKIAQELQLGFATNETSTTDEQSWLCAGSTWESYINDITKSAWKDENSFYKCFIDVYYHLNFINVNNQVEGDGTMAAGILDNAAFKDFYSNDKGTEERTQQPVGKFLTNIESAQGSNMFVRQYETKNESSQVHEKYGYKYNSQFFDLKSLKYWNLYVDPKTSDGAEKKKIILKGRTFPKKEDEKKPDGTSPSEEQYWRTQNQYVWKGVQSRNVHDKFIYATGHNERNLLELKKLYLNVMVERWNPNIYMGEKIPLILISQSDHPKAMMDAQGQDADAVNKSPGQPLVLDQFYSGYYMVNGMMITWGADQAQNSPSDMPNGRSGPSFYQTFVMTRREWPTPLG